MTYSPKAAFGRIVSMARALPAALMPTSDARLRDAYLDEAVDQIDLEMRIRKLDQPQPRPLFGLRNTDLFAS